MERVVYVRPGSQRDGRYEGAADSGIRVEQQLGIPQAEYLKIEELERKLNSFQQYKEIVLWFEYDLYDRDDVIVSIALFQRTSTPEYKTESALH